MTTEAALRGSTFTVKIGNLPLVTGNARLHHMARANRVAHLRASVAVLAKLERTRLGIPKAQPGTRAKVHLVLIRGPSQKLLDHDSVGTALKPCLDALGPDIGVRISKGRASYHPGSDWIAGDSEKLIDYSFSQERGDIPAIRVEITRCRCQVIATWVDCPQGRAPDTEPRDC